MAHNVENKNFGPKKKERDAVPIGEFYTGFS